MQRSASRAQEPNGPDANRYPPILKLGSGLAAIVALYLSACSAGSDGGSGQGGKAGSGAGGLASGGAGTASGGSSGKGGALGSGGSALGGATASGGATSSGGKVGTGGAPGFGGSTAQAGATGGSGTNTVGGATSSGGKVGTGGATTSLATGGTGPGGSGTGVSGSGGVGSRDAGAGGTTSAGGMTGRDASTGTDSNAGAYQPCPSTGSACKLLPLGDSITFGVGDEGNAGYRGPLFASAVAAGKQLTFTGSLSNGPSTVSGQTFPKNNEGHSGWGISEVTPYSNNNAGIATRIPSPAFDSGSGGLPNIILLHIGTNDQGSLSAAQMTKDLTGLIDKLITNAPDALLVVAQIIPLGYGTNDVIKTYNQSIPGIVKARADAGKHIVTLDMYTGFTASSMLGSDSIHPNTTGYKFMAERWYSAIGSLLP